MDNPADDEGQNVSLTFRTLAEVPGVLAGLVELAKARGYSERAIFGMRLALEEVLTNAVRHGNQGDASKTVKVEARVTDEAAEFSIEDEGEGFVPEAVPDCTDEANLMRPGGRGVMLIKAYMTDVRYNDRGNRVTLVKRRDCERPVLDDD